MFTRHIMTLLEIINPKMAIYPEDTCTHGPPVKYFTDRSKAVLLLWIFYVFVLSCVCYVCARLFICALWSPAGKGLTSWLSFVVSSVSLSLFHWYPGSGVVLDCIDS